MKARITLERDPHPILRVSGDLDFRSAPEVKEYLLQAIASDGAALAVDMSEIGFVDSTGLSALFEAAKFALRDKTKIRLLGVPRSVRKLLSMCGFIDFFDILAAPEPEVRPEPASELGEPVAGRVELPGVASSVPCIRRCIEEVARAMGFGETPLKDLLIAVSEAATNAMKHGSPRGADSRIVLRYQPDGDRLIVEVTDEGAGFDPLAVPVPVAEQMREGGMGVFFIRTLMDEVSFRHEEGGTTVQMIKYL